MRILGKEELYDIVYGAAIYGTGGGGSLTVGLSMIDDALRQGRTFTLVDFDELDGDDMTVAEYNEKLAADPNNVSNDKLKPAESDTPKSWSMGNIHDADFMMIWNSEQAAKVRAKVRKCPKNCWMVGTASPVMHKYIKYPLKWALKNKLRSMLGKPACLDFKYCNVGQDPQQGDLNFDR